MRNTNKSKGENTQKKGFILSVFHRYGTLLFLIAMFGACFLLKRARYIKSEIDVRIKSAIHEAKKVKRLEYYYFVDEKKSIDIDKRKRVYGFLSKAGSTIATIMMFLLLGISATVQLVFKETYSWFILDAASLIGVIMIVSISVTALYKFTTLVYVSTPFIGMLIFESLGSSISYKVPLLPTYQKMLLYLSIAVALYSLLMFFVPVHILRRLSGKTALISASISVFVTFLPQIFIFHANQYFTNRLQTLTVSSVTRDSSISRVFRDIIRQNPDLLSAVKQFLISENLSEAISEITMFGAFLTLSYIIGGLLINHKIQKCKRLARRMYRDIVINPHLSKYESLVKCAFLGGEEYEDLLLSIPDAQKIILKHESGITVYRITVKERLILFFKKSCALVLGQ
ncbi:hypothetical protein OIU41_12520 [Lacticaseibacillus paracasei]